MSPHPVKYLLKVCTWVHSVFIAEQTSNCLNDFYWCFPCPNFNPFKFLRRSQWKRYQNMKTSIPSHEACIRKHTLKKKQAKRIKRIKKESRWEKSQQKSSLRLSELLDGEQKNSPAGSPGLAAVWIPSTRTTNSAVATVTFMSHFSNVIYQSKQDLINLRK